MKDGTFPNYSLSPNTIEKAMICSFICWYSFNTTFQRTLLHSYSAIVLELHSTHMASEHQANSLQRNFSLLLPNTTLGDTATHPLSINQLHSAQRPRPETFS